MDGLRMIRDWWVYKLRFLRFRLSLVPLRWGIPIFVWSAPLAALCIPETFYLSQQPVWLRFITLGALLSFAMLMTRLWLEDVQRDLTLHKNVQPWNPASLRELPYRAGHILYGRGFVLTQELMRSYDLIMRRERWISDERRKDSQLDAAAYAEKWGPGEGQPEIFNVGASDAEPLYLPFTQLTRQTTVLGGTGSGKTKFLLGMAAGALRDGKRLIFIDPKGDQSNLDALYTLYQQGVFAGLRAPGQFYRLAPFTPGTHTYNALKTYTYADDLAGRIMSMLPVSPGSEPYFKLASEMTAKLILRAQVGAGQIPTLRGVLDTLDHASVRQELLAQLKSRGSDPAVIRDFTAFCKLEQDAIKRDSSNLRAILFTMTSTGLDEVLSPTTSDIDWPGIFASDSAVVYINTEGLINDTASEALAQAVTRDFLEFVGQFYKNREMLGGAESLDTLVIIDEAHNAANKAFLKALATVRGAGVGVVAATQSLADIEEVLGVAGMRRFLANTNTKIFLRITDPQTQEIIVNLLPKMSFFEVSDMDAVNPSTTTVTDQGLPFSDQYRRSITEKTREMLSQEVLGELPTGVGLCLSGGTVTAFQGFLLPPPVFRYSPKTDFSGFEEATG